MAQYEYDLFKPEEVHMAIAAEQIVTGMYEKSNAYYQARKVLAMIPKHKNLPLGNHMGVEGWGLHAIHGFSLRKILYWIVAVTAVGLIFVILWLIFMNKTDLQNVFAPAMFLGTLIMMGLAIPQILGVV